jgi:hypothetical protein
MVNLALYGGSVVEGLMKRLTMSLAAVALSGCVLPALPMGAGLGSNPAEAARLKADLEQAQTQASAQASRPGDANMDCAAIEAELMAQMRDPKFQAAMASMGARAQADKAKIDAAMAGGKTVQPDPTSAGASQAAMGADLVTMMPQMMRGQRLNELGQARNCAFLKAAKPS